MDINNAPANIARHTKIAFVVVLSRDSDGPVYLGKLDCGRQGVRRIENAIRWKSRESAETIAMGYGKHANVIVVAK